MKHLSGGGDKEQRRWKANEETRRKLHENLGLGDWALIDLNLKTLLAIHISDAMKFSF